MSFAGVNFGLWCCAVGWHKKPYEVLRRDQVNTHARCRRCGFEGMVDSQGNLF